MKHRFWLFKRGGTFYLQDSLTGKRESLATRDRKEAELIRATKDMAIAQPHINLALGKAYLAAHDPKLVQRKWQTVMDEFARHGQEQTRKRKERAIRNRPLRLLAEKKLVETTADDLREVMALGGTSANHFLRCIHNLALGFGWLPAPIIPSKFWPARKAKAKRGITKSEH